MINIVALRYLSNISNYNINCQNLRTVTGTILGNNTNILLNEEY